MASTAVSRICLQDIKTLDIYDTTFTKQRPLLILMSLTEKRVNLAPKTDMLIFAEVLHFCQMVIPKFRFISFKAFLALSSYS